MLMAGQRMKKSNKIFDLFSLKQILHKGRELISSLLFPPRCVVCDELLTPEEAEAGIHNICKKQLQLVKTPTCMQCGRPITEVHREYCYECKKIEHKFSGKPRQGEVQRPIIQGKALYLYEGAVKTAMYRFKYSNKREYAMFFARETKKIYGDWLKRIDVQVIVPVPMYLPKQKRRGYNQAESFAEELSFLTGIPVDKNLIKRVKDTTPQKELNPLERKNNLKNAFQKGKSIVQYTKVLIVDDIYTTGSTVWAVAEEMKKTGIVQVYTLSLCIGGDQ